MTLTAAERKKLRDAIDQSRRDYESERAERRRRADLPAERPPLDPFLLTGDIAEQIAALEIAVADLDDTGVSIAVAALRARVTDVGNFLARRRATYAGNNGGVT